MNRRAPVLVAALAAYSILLYLSSMTFCYASAASDAADPAMA